ncbi:MAG: hypothetical protein LBT83_05045 [Tannerella sp.]|nr:hypothetical protein [Tannerella sp.]
MKRTLSISFVVTSMLLLLAFTFVPHHHHHGSMFCLVTERCEQDGVVNDEHTGHEDSGDDEASCIIETNYVVSAVNDDTKCKVLPSDHPHRPAHLYPAICFWADAPTCKAMTSTVRCRYGEYVRRYTSAPVSLSNGLRAPPPLS